MRTKWMSFLRGKVRPSPISRPVDPTKGSDIPNYFDAFAVCERFSASASPLAEPMTLRSTEEDPHRLAPALTRVILSNKITEDDFRASAGQCLKWAHFLAPHIERETGLAAWPTLGQLWKGDRKVWGPTWSELEALLKQGIHPQDIANVGGSGLNMHAWVTLATGEVVDLTFASTLAVVKGDHYAGLLGLISYGPEERVFNEHRYFPMLAGATAIEALQGRSSLPFLARTREELALIQVAFVPC